jgi:prevent-host-death family protein
MSPGQSCNAGSPGLGVQYRCWGKRLGRWLNPRPDSPDTALRARPFAGYAAHMRSPEFRSAIDDLLDEVTAARTAIMCAESVWWRCHRRMVADFVVLARGVPVHHLMHDGRLQEHVPSDLARLREDRLLVYDAGQHCWMDRPPAASEMSRQGATAPHGGAVLAEMATRRNPRCGRARRRHIGLHEGPELLCATMSHMTTVGVRELRRYASRWLARVRAGETFVVTDRGRPVARLSPIEEQAGYEKLVADGRIARGSGRGLVDVLTALDADIPPDRGPSVTAALSDLRVDER